MNAKLISELRDKAKVFLQHGHDAEILEISASKVRIITTPQKVVFEVDRV
jgi:hypothetical protein